MMVSVKGEYHRGRGTQIGGEIERGRASELEGH